MMSVTLCIPLKAVGGQRDYQLRLELGEAGAGVSPVQRHGTAAALLGYIDEKARGDQELSQECVSHLRYTRDEASDTLESDEDRESVRAAELLGRRVRDIGDEFMAEVYGDPRTSSWIEAMVDGRRGSTSGQSAFSHFCDAVNIILQCDESGTAQVITVGRLAALFSYCYHLCKVFIIRKGVMGVVGFLGQLFSYLIRSLYRSRFYEWLTSQGGWRQLLKQTYQIVPAVTSSPYLLTTLAFGSALLLAFIAFRHFRGNQ